MDDADDWVLEHTWSAAKRGTVWYAFRNQQTPEGTTPVYLHCELMGPAPEGHIVDHQNGSGLDCRRGNLRFVTYAENLRNTRTPRCSTSGYKGVSRGHKGRWRAYITVDGHQKGLGEFATPEEANLARLAAEETHWGISPRRVPDFEEARRG